MPQPSTLSYIADLIIRRVLAEEHTNVDLAAALERAYPFDDSVEGRRIWLDALLRNAVASAAQYIEPDPGASVQTGAVNYLGSCSNLANFGVTSARQCKQQI